MNDASRQGRSYISTPERATVNHPQSPRTTPLFVIVQRGFCPIKQMDCTLSRTKQPSVREIDTAAPPTHTCASQLQERLRIRGMDLRARAGWSSSFSLAAVCFPPRQCGTRLVSRSPHPTSRQSPGATRPRHYKWPGRHTVAAGGPPADPTAASGTDTPARPVAAPRRRHHTHLPRLQAAQSAASPAGVLPASRRRTRAAARVPPRFCVCPPPARGGWAPARSPPPLWSGSGGGVGAGLYLGSCRRRQPRIPPPLLVHVRVHGWGRRRGGGAERSHAPRPCRERRGGAGPVAVTAVVAPHHPTTARGPWSAGNADHPSPLPPRRHPPRPSAHGDDGQQLSGHLWGGLPLPSSSPTPHRRGVPVARPAPATPW